MLSRDERSYQAYCLVGHRSISFAGSDRGGNSDIAAADHKRFFFHFTPTSCSWLNAVEGYFAKLSKQRLQRGVFRSVVELETAIDRFIEETNQAPKPFVWTADPRKIIAAVRRGHQVLDSIH